MKRKLSIGIVGDYQPGRPSQVKTNEALEHTADSLSIEIDGTWLPTTALVKADQKFQLSAFDAIFAGPGEYINPDGAMAAIQSCREKDRPFLGT